MYYILQIYYQPGRRTCIIYVLLIALLEANDTMHKYWWWGRSEVIQPIRHIFIQP